MAKQSQEYRAAMRSRGNLIMARDWTTMETAVSDAKVMLGFSRPTHAIIEVEARMEDGTVRELNDSEVRSLRRLAGSASGR